MYEAYMYETPPVSIIVTDECTCGGCFLDTCVDDRPLGYIYADIEASCLFICFLSKFGQPDGRKAVSVNTSAYANSRQKKKKSAIFSRIPARAGLKYFGALG